MTHEIIKNIPEFFRQFEEKNGIPIRARNTNILGKGKDGKTSEQRSEQAKKGAETRRRRMGGLVTISILIPEKLLAQIEVYQERMAYSSRTQAILGCIRNTISR